MRSAEPASRIVGRLLGLVPLAHFAAGARLMPRTRSILGALLGLVAGNKRLVPEFLPHLLQVTAALPGTTWMDDVDLSTIGAGQPCDEPLTVAEHAPATQLFWEEHCTLLLRIGAGDGENGVAAVLAVVLPILRATADTLLHFLARDSPQNLPEANHACIMLAPMIIGIFNAIATLQVCDASAVIWLNCSRLAGRRHCWRWRGSTHRTSRRKS